MSDRMHITVVEPQLAKSWRSGKFHS